MPAPSWQSDLEKNIGADSAKTITGADNQQDTTLSEDEHNYPMFFSQVRCPCQTCSHHLKETTCEENFSPYVFVCILFQLPR